MTYSTPASAPASDDQFESCFSKRETHPDTANHQLGNWCFELLGLSATFGEGRRALLWHRAFYKERRMFIQGRGLALSMPGRLGPKTVF